MNELILINDWTSCKSKQKNLPIGRFFLLLAQFDYSNEAIAFLMISMASRSSASVMTKGGAKRMMC